MASGRGLGVVGLEVGSLKWHQGGIRGSSAWGQGL